MDPITARQALARLTLERNFPDQPPYSADEEYTEWERNLDPSTTPTTYTAPPAFLINLFLNGVRYLKFGDEHPTVFAVRKPPLDRVTSVPDFVSEDVTRSELQSMLEAHTRNRSIIEQPLPHDMPNTVRNNLMEAGYSPTVPPQADPSLFRNGIVFDDVDRVVFLTPGNLSELLTDGHTVAGYTESPVYLRISKRNDTLQTLMAEDGREIEPDPTRYSAAND